MTDTQQASAAPAALVWKARPIFVSSTFKDMNAERDYLRAHGLKELEERLRARCHYLDMIDLRQGVETGDAADEAAREMQVLKVCLDEIERSKPFLVALLGDRYGWVPPAARIEAAARDAGLPPSVEVAGRSVTELEILYGVLENPDQKRRSRFYFRTVDRAGMPPEVAARFPADAPDADPASPVGRLNALKERIKREMPGRWREYTLSWDPAKNQLAGLDTLDGDVVADLWAELDAETAAYLRDAPQTWQEADARAVADFVAERTRCYVERPAVTDPLLAHAVSPEAPDTGWGVVLAGAPGSGKSCLFGRTWRDLAERAARGELVLLAHAAGIFPLSGQVDRMLRRWITELATHLHVPDPIEAAERAATEEAGPGERLHERPRITSEDIERAFAQLLGRAAAQTRVVLLADALNQFEPSPRARYLTWLPKLWPPNARFIATTLPGDAGTALADRPGCRVIEVPPVSRVEARDIAERFYRERHHRAVNPRVLDTLLDKAQPGGAPAHANPLWLALALQEMNLLEADDFERAERDFAALEPAARITALQCAEAANLPPDIPGVYGELLGRAERTCGTARTRAFTGLVALSRSGWRESDLRELMPRVSGEPWDELAFAGIRRALGLHVVQRGAHAQWDFFHGTLRGVVLGRDLPEEAGRQRLHGMIADHLESLPPDDPLRISEAMFHLMGLGDRARAAGYMAVVGSRRWSNWSAKAALAAAVTVLTRAIQAAGDDAERSRITAWIASLLKGTNHDRTHRVAQVLLFDLNDALAVTGTTATETARKALLEAARNAMTRLTVYDALKTKGIIGFVSRCWFHLRRLAASNPTNVEWQRDLFVSQAYVGDVLLQQGDLAGALRAYRESLAVAERLAASDPTNAGWQRDLSVNHRNIGDVLLAQGDLAGALSAYRESLTVDERLVASDPTNAGGQRDLSVSQNRVGDVLLQQGNLAGALRAYQETLAVRERLAASNPTNVEWQRDTAVSQERIGSVLQAQGDLAGALRAYRESLAVQEYLAASDPTNADWQRGISGSQGRIGDVLRAQGDLAGGLGAYWETQVILERLAASDPSNAGWQRDLSVSQERIGDILRAQGGPAGALRAYRESLAVRERLAASDPSNAGWQRDLMASYWRMADISERAGRGNVRVWWRKAYNTLADMDRRGIMLPTDAQYLEALRQRWEE